MTYQNSEGDGEEVVEGEGSSVPVVDVGGDTVRGDDVDDGDGGIGPSTGGDDVADFDDGDDGHTTVAAAGGTSSAVASSPSTSSSPSPPPGLAADTAETSTTTTITPSSPSRRDGDTASSASASTASVGGDGATTPITGRQFIQRLLMQQQRQRQQQQGRGQAGTGPTVRLSFRPKKDPNDPAAAEAARRMGEAVAAQPRLQQRQPRHSPSGGDTAPRPPSSTKDSSSSAAAAAAAAAASDLTERPKADAHTNANAAGGSGIESSYAEGSSSPPARSSSTTAAAPSSANVVPRPPSSAAAAAAASPMKMRSGFLLSSPKKAKPGKPSSAQRSPSSSSSSSPTSPSKRSAVTTSTSDLSSSSRVGSGIAGVTSPGEGGADAAFERGANGGAGDGGIDEEAVVGGGDGEGKSRKGSDPTAIIPAEDSSSRVATAAAPTGTAAAPRPAPSPEAAGAGGDATGVGGAAAPSPIDDGTGGGAAGFGHPGGGLSIRLGGDGSIILSPTTTNPAAAPGVEGAVGDGGGAPPTADAVVPTVDDGGDAGDAPAVVVAEESSSGSAGGAGSSAPSTSSGEGRRSQAHNHSHSHSHSHAHAHGRHHHHHHHHHGHGRGLHQRRGPTAASGATPNNNGGGGGTGPRILINGVPVPVTVRRGGGGGGGSGGGAGGGSNGGGGGGGLPQPRVVVNGVPVQNQRIPQPRVVVNGVPVQNPGQGQGQGQQQQQQQQQQRWQQVWQHRPGGAGPGPQVVTQQVQIHLPPLVAQPVPHHLQQSVSAAAATAGTSGEGSSDDARGDAGGKVGGGVDAVEPAEDTKKAADDSEATDTAAARQAAYACSICLECMDDPAGCGNCSNRFCYTCLERVARGGGSGSGGGVGGAPPPQPTSNADGNGNGNGAKCPCCRSALTVDTIRRDEELRGRMDREDPAPCPNPGCGARLKLSALKGHEMSCPHVVMRCKYAPFGCKWTGTRADLEGRHDVVDDVGGCPYGRVGGLVDHLRLTRAVHDQQINHLQQQVVAANRLIHIQGNTLVSLQSKSVDNVFDILALVHLSLCHSQRFLMTKDLWRQLHGTPETRAVVYNFLYLVPTLVLVIKICLHTAAREEEGELFDHVDQLLFSVLVCALSIFAMTCFRIDASSALSWKSDRIWRCGDRMVFRDAAASCLMMVISCGIDWYESSSLAGFVAWCFVSVATVVVPPAIAPILEAASGQAAEQGGVGANSARARSVVLFGLRYGLLQSLVGILPAFNAVALLRLSKSVYETLRRPKVLPNWITQEDSDCFLSEVGLQSWSFLAVASIAATLAFEWPDRPGYFLFGVVDVVLNCGALVFINSFVRILERLGEVTGKGLTSTTLAMLTRRRDNAADGVVQAGSALYCCWLVCLACVVISNP